MTTVTNINSENTFKKLILKHYEDYSVSAGLERINEFREKLTHLQNLEIENMDEFKRCWGQAVNEDLSRLDNKEFWKMFQGFIWGMIEKYGKIIERDLALADDMFTKHVHGMVSGDWSKAVSIIKERIKLGKELAEKFDTDLNFIEFMAVHLDL